MTAPTPVARPWAALWSMIIGFFMMLVDATIVSIANPVFQAAFNPHSEDMSGILWITSAYLLASGVPLLIAGRLGDVFGQKSLYLTGLVIFTVASLGCGLSGSLGVLIAWRTVQGIGAALLTPQTMAVITRIFPLNQRGRAMSLWGATAGVATLVGPLLGGVLIAAFGWPAIFFINVPVGVVGFVLAWRFVPSLPGTPQHLDILGTVLSGVGLGLVIFGVQEGERFHWGRVSGLITVPGLLVAGVLLLAAFVWWQGVSRRAVVMPLALFRDHNFRVASVGITLVGLAVTAVNVPLLIYAQSVRGLSPLLSAFFLVPGALTSIASAQPMGRLLDRLPSPRWVSVSSLVLWGLCVLGYAGLMWGRAPIWCFLVVSGVLGLANSGMWSPLGTAATRNLGPSLAGAGSGVYNMVRTVGSVLGSAGIAALMDARVAALGAGGLSGALAQSMLLPALAGFLAAVAGGMLAPYAGVDARPHA